MSVFRRFGTGLLGCDTMWLGKDSDVSGLVFWDVTLCGRVRIPTFRDWCSGTDTMWLGEDSDISGLVFWDVILCGWVRIPTFRVWPFGM